MDCSIPPAFFGDPLDTVLCSFDLASLQALKSVGVTWAAAARRVLRSEPYCERLRLTLLLEEKAPVSAVLARIRTAEGSAEAYSPIDEEGNLPLHRAIADAQPDTTILALLDGALARTAAVSNRWRMLPLHFAAQGCSDLDTVDFVWSAYPRLSLSLSPSLSRFLSRAFSVCARARVCVSPTLSRSLTLSLSP